jgi:hypothetical protein
MTLAPSSTVRSSDACPGQSIQVSWSPSYETFSKDAASSSTRCTTTGLAGRRVHENPRSIVRPSSRLAGCLSSAAVDSISLRKRTSVVFPTSTCPMTATLMLRKRRVCTRGCRASDSYPGRVERPTPGIFWRTTENEPSTGDSASLVFKENHRGYRHVSLGQQQVQFSALVQKLPPCSSDRRKQRPHLFRLSTVETTFYKALFLERRGAQAPGSPQCAPRVIQQQNPVDNRPSTFT